MVLTQSTMLELKTTAPDFNLMDVVSGKNMTLADFQNKKILLVMFICRHCPYVVHIKEQLVALNNDYASKDIALVGISSNDASSHPADAPPSLKEFMQENKLSFPLLYDETQEVAKAYTAACTPDFFLYDRGRTLIYRGQLDESRPGNDKPLTGKDLRDAIDAALADKPVTADQKPSAGCNIKWREGNAPCYFGPKNSSCG
jgi:peroxiredoxin